MHIYLPLAILFSPPGPAAEGDEFEENDDVLGFEYHGHCLFANRE